MEGRQSLEKRLRRERKQGLENKNSYKGDARREKDEMEWNLLPVLSTPRSLMILASSRPLI